MTYIFIRGKHAKNTISQACFPTDWISGAGALQTVQANGEGGGGTPIIFSWGCAAGTLRTLNYTRPC